MLFKIRTPHHHVNGRVFSYLVLILSLGVSLIVPLLPIYVKEMLNTDQAVSLFYSAIAVIMFIAALLSTIVFSKVKRTSITNIAFIVCAIAVFIFIFTNRIGEFGFFESLRVIFRLFLFMALALFIRDFTRQSELGKEEGFFYRYTNIGFLIGPLVGGFLAAWFGYEIVFILSSAIFLIGFLYFYHLNVIQPHPAIIKSQKEISPNLTRNLKVFFSDKDRTKAFFISFLMILFGAFKWLFVPLYVVSSGYMESMSGLILALGILPLIFLEVRVGQYADKHGIRLPVWAGFGIFGLTMMIIFFSPFILLNFLLLAVMNLGEAFLEPVADYYLLEHTPKKEENNLFGIYIAAGPLASIVAPTFSALILFFLPFKFLFLIFGGIFILGSIYFHFKLKNS
ncbi:MAG: MFS transporter [Candidatus Gracilibacteria bacterium]